MIGMMMCVLAVCTALHASAQQADDGAHTRLTIEDCVNEFSPEKIDSTAVGYQYWFINKTFLDGRTIKMSVVRAHEATHEPHSHVEDEFFFVLDGTAELALGDERRIVGPLTSFYCPPSVAHAIRNAGNSPLKYLVIKKYPSEDRAR